jgi:Family of unknown function (DUF6338)
MPDIFDPSTFEFFARYLLAGFVFLSVRARFVQGERPAPSESMIEAVILSLINQAIFLLLTGWIPASLLTQSYPAILRLMAEVILLPAITGTLFGWLINRRFMPDGLRRLFMPFSKPVSHAYEHAFARLEGPSFILVAYLDGREVYGYFGPQSMASSDLAGGGLFIERLYSVGTGGEWTEVVPERSAWVTLTGARSIEFFEQGED